MGEQQTNEAPEEAAAPPPENTTGTADKIVADAESVGDAALDYASNFVPGVGE